MEIMYLPDEDGHYPVYFPRADANLHRYFFLDFVYKFSYVSIAVGNWLSFLAIRPVPLERMVNVYKSFATGI